MKLALITILITFISCQTYNANTFDQEKYGVIELEGGPNFKASYAILQDKCMSCHRHAQWATYTKTQDWVTNENLVIDGDPDNSQLIYRIINHGGASSDMPQGGQALPAAEYQKLVEWVTDINS
jgi:uncharacterized membrane protein